MDDASETDTGRTQGGRRWLVALPLVLFAALAGVFLYQLTSGKDSSVVPSVLIGREAPATSLPPLESTGLPGLESSGFQGKVTVLNVWASWCAPCREEHPLLMEMAKDGRFVIAGLNYKDKPENAARFLGTLGNPYSMIGRDENGRGAIDWGVYGVPETFIVGKDGRIAFKHVGPLTPAILQNQFMPEIEKALAAN